MDIDGILFGVDMKCNECGLDKDKGEFRKYRHDCIECEKKMHREWGAKNSDKIKGYNSEKYYKDVNQSRERVKEYAKKNPEKIKEANKKYYHANKESQISKVRKWFQDNRDKKQEYHRTHRARLQEVGGVFTASDWKSVLKEQGNKCLCCGTTNDLTHDHIVPVKNGGANTKENAQVLCRSCNSTKGTKTIDYRPEWLRAK